jgi:anaerobic selenocysteine-containing dehydrogenase
MGFTEPWLQQSADEVIAEVLAETAVSYPALHDITLARLQAEGQIQLPYAAEVPFADGRFPTPSGKVELYCQTMADMGVDPLPGYLPSDDDGGFGINNDYPKSQSLNLITGAAHHFTTSTFANQAALRQREGEPFVEIHPSDAVVRGIENGARVRVENGRGWCELTAVVTDTVRPGVAASPKGYWSQHNGGRNINWTTSDALGDLAGQSTFHTNRVWIIPVASN